MPAQKTAITFEPELLREVKVAADEMTGGNVSAWLADAARTKLRVRKMKEFVAEFEQEHGEITDEEMDEARKKWLG